MIIFLYCIILFLLITNVYIFVSYLKILKSLKEYNNIGTGRQGFYKYYRLSMYEAYVYVKEIDRYINGYSKIEIIKIEPRGSYREDSTSYAKDNFVSLVLTTNIEWLEGEDHLKKVRKEKLDNIKKL